MSEGVIPLAIGTILALLALILVLAPLLSEHQSVDTMSSAGSRPGPTSASEEVESAISALREIEFDRETGKLSDSDYHELKQRYTRAALEEMRSDDAGRSTTEGGQAAMVAPVSINDAVEAAIEKARFSQRNCSDCGPRPEPDATYCSNCGRYLPGVCGRCGATVNQAASRFCSSCGEQLAA